MWTKTVDVKYKKITYQVMAWLSDSNDDGETVSIQSMASEFFLFETVKFENRDSAYDFIKYFTVNHAKAFLIRLGYENQAL